MNHLFFRGVWLIYPVALLSSCRTSAQPPLSIARPPAAAVLPAEERSDTILPNDQVRTPSVSKAYFVGAIRDPRHPELLYRPGLVIREEVPEGWNLNPRATRGAVTGALRSLPDPAILPPTAPETEQLVVKQQQLMQLLAASNAELTARVAELEGNAAPPTGVEAPAIHAVDTVRNPATFIATNAPVFVPAATPSPAVDFEHAIVPNADGVIELSPQVLDPLDVSEPNPFAVRYQVRTVYRELPVEITATVPGPRPTATINGQLVNPGDAWDSFTIAGISRDAVFFKKASFLLKVPIARDRAYLIRLPE